MSQSAYDQEYRTYGQRIRMSSSAAYNNISMGAQGIYQRDTSTDKAINPYLHPYSFMLHKSYKTRAQHLRDILHENYRKGVAKAGQIQVSELLTAVTDDNPVFTRFSVDDTSPGGNEAINCRWGFGRDDDIIDPMNALMGRPELGGLGRVYNETYQVNQQLLHISVGVPEFQALWEFYQNAVDADAVTDVNSGSSLKIGRMLGGVIGGSIKLAVKLLAFPYTFPAMLADILDGTERVTRYYDLRTAMPMFYRYANSILAHICVNLGMFPNTWTHSEEQPNEKEKGLLNRVENAATAGTTRGTQSNVSMMDLYRDSGAIPDFIDKTGPSIYKILTKRDYRLGILKQETHPDSDDFLSYEKIKAQSGSLWSIFKTRAQATATGADKFISFRINKSTDSSESVSNSTGQPMIAQFLNQQAAAGRDKMFSLGGDRNMLEKIPLVGGLIKGASDVVMGAANQVGVVGLASAVMTGSGFIDIPDVWTNSSYSKNYNFSITLRAPAADNVSIVQSLYLPLSLLLAMSCPRSVGTNSYTSPFLIKGYAKGMFAVPLGIVDALTIIRGASEFGWNMCRLPTVINVSLSIKDLAPIMHLAITDKDSWLKIFGNNTSFQEYMLTLSAMGPQERMLNWPNIKRRISAISKTAISTYGNPAYWGTWLGDTVYGRVYGGFSPISGLPSN